MIKRRKREFQSSELLKSFAKLYGFEHKLFALEIKGFLLEMFGYQEYNGMISVNFINNILVMRLSNPMLRQDFQLRKSFFLRKIQDNFGDERIVDLEII